MTYYAAPGVLKSATRAYTFEDIEKVVCEYYKIDRDTLYEPCRKHRIVLARQIMSFFAIEFLTMGTKELGQRMKRHHSTMITSRDTIKGYIGYDNAFAAEIDSMRKLITEARFDN